MNECKTDETGEEFLKLMVKEYCKKPKLLHTTDLSGYYHDALRHFNKAIQFKTDRKDFGAYIELIISASHPQVFESKTFVCANDKLSSWGLGNFMPLNSNMISILPYLVILDALAAES